MLGHPETVEDAKALMEYISTFPSVNQASKDTKIKRSTLRARIKRAEQLLKQSDPKRLSVSLPKHFEPPALESGEKPIEQLISDIKAEFERKHRAKKSRDWMRFNVKIDGAVCFAFVGDPHVDDNGCNWPLLDRDRGILKDTEGMLPIGMGDYTNNWIGKLSLKKYPDQEITRSNAWRLAEYFIKGIPWLLLIRGNHDAWSGSADPIKWISEGTIYEDWQAKFVVDFPNGRNVKIWAAHDFKGNSMWNANHGVMKKEVLTGTIADIYAAGDKHNWMVTRYENPNNGKCPIMLRARGYKFIDEYAEQLGYESQQTGATVAVVCDPYSNSSDWMLSFSDLEAAADYLKYLRGRK